MTAGLVVALLPAGVSAVELHDFGAADPLLPNEMADLGPVGPGRAAEFAAGRHCARAAIVALGLAGRGVGVGAGGGVGVGVGGGGGVGVGRSGRAPRWPDGVVGSITHCAGYAAAAVGSASTVDSMGIDVEPNLALPRIVGPRITVPAERSFLRKAPVCGVHWDRLLFAIKESVYKAWAPLTGTWLDFPDATVTVDVAAQRFHAAITPPGRPGPACFAGRFQASPDFLAAAIVVPRPAGPQLCDTCPAEPPPTGHVSHSCGSRGPAGVGGRG